MAWFRHRTAEEAFLQGVNKINTSLSKNKGLRTLFGEWLRKYLSTQNLLSVVLCR